MWRAALTYGYRYFPFFINNITNLYWAIEISIQWLTWDYRDTWTEILIHQSICNNWDTRSEIVRYRFIDRSDIIEIHVKIRGISIHWLTWDYWDTCTEIVRYRLIDWSEIIEIPYRCCVRRSYERWRVFVHGINIHKHGGRGCVLFRCVLGVCPVHLKYVYKVYILQRLVVNAIRGRRSDLVVGQCKLAVGNRKITVYTTWSLAIEGCYKFIWNKSTLNILFFFIIYISYFRRINLKQAIYFILRKTTIYRFVSQGEASYFWQNKTF